MPVGGHPAWQQRIESQPYVLPPSQRANTARAIAEMVGKSMWCKLPLNALTQQRLHHAYLFTGTRG